MVRRLEGPPWPDLNKVKYPELPKPQDGSLRLKRSSSKPAALELELPPQWRGGGKDGNIYFVIEPGTAQGTAYWSNSASKRELAPVLVIDYEKK